MRCSHSRGWFAVCGWCGRKSPEQHERKHPVLCVVFQGAHMLDSLGRDRVREAPQQYDLGPHQDMINKDNSMR
eukprot:3686999-Amphidinium_carterae.1